MRGSSVLFATCFALITVKSFASVEPRDLDGSVVNGYEAFFDPVQNITWISDANLFATQYNGLSAPERALWLQNIIATTPVVAGHTVTTLDFSFPLAGGLTTGVMSWWGAQAYANSAEYFGETGWRLPTMVDIGGDGCNEAYSGTDCGWSVNTANAELAYLHYEILQLPPSAGPQGQVLPGNNIPSNSSLPIPDVSGAFVTHVYSDSYWYGTAYEPNADYAWGFRLFSGRQEQRLKTGQFSVMRTWLVADGDVFSPVPEASTFLLFGFGTLAVYLRARVRKH